MGLMQETEEQAEHLALAPHELRALQALASADAALAEPRHGMESAAEWERTAPRPETIQRAAEPADIVRKTKTQPAPDAFLKVSVFEDVAHRIIKSERDHAAARIAEAVAPLLARVCELEARLAHSEGRLASVESRKGKK